MDIKYKLCTKIIKEEITRKNDNNIISIEEKIEEKPYMLIQYNNKEIEYSLKGKQNIEEFSKLEPLKLLKIINIEEKKYFIYTNAQQVLTISDNQKDILEFASKGLKIKFTKDKIKILLLGFVYTKITNLNDHNIMFNFAIGNCKNKKEVLSVYSNKINKIKKLLNLNHYKQIEFNMKDIVNNEEEMLINNGVNLKISLDNHELIYPIKMKKKVKKTKYNYLPFKFKKFKNFYIIARKTTKQNLVIVKREIEEIEKDSKFKLYESKPFTLFFKILGGIYRILPSKKINLYFEKFSSKAEEGTFELFEKARDNSKNSKNYYIITDEEDNKYYLSQKNVCAKFSFKYYFLLFASTNIISTEAPPHLNLLRTKNKQIKKSIYDKEFIFLQHGITYLKCQGKNSTFTKGKEAFPKYIVASSKKEALVLNKALNISIDKIMITGMTIFDKIKYNHINKNVKDKIVIMLTWKPYEEQLIDFTKSTYYKYTLNLYNMLKNLINKEDIIIIPHPKVKEKMLLTPFGESVYSGAISDILKEGKIVITDYSSICYNSFYQGAGVIFYQPDLEMYEKDNGQLIPNDDEYIGYRCMDDKELKNILEEGINNKKINLEYYRKKDFVDNYKTINEFCDGRNTDRIYEFLKEKEII